MNKIAETKGLSIRERGYQNSNEKLQKVSLSQILSMLIHVWYPKINGKTLSVYQYYRQIITSKI